MAGFAPPEKKPVGVPARAPAFRVGPHATPSARAMEPEAKTQPRSDAVRVSSPSDPAEREADAIAQRLVSAGAAPTQPGLPPVPPPPRQAPGGGRLLSVAPDFVTRLDAARKAGGQPLPADLRTDFHRRLGGAALDDVRLHTGARASSLAASARARAFTVERDIFFRDGNYQPASGGGRRLIAHEVAHALQPAAAAPVISRAPDDAQGATATPTPQSDARRQQRNDADELAALLLNLLNAPALVPRSETDLLLASAESIQRRFEQSDLPRTQFVAARALVVLVQELSQREAAAPRGPEGELLRPDSFGPGMVPWTKDKPRALIAIPPFSPENIAAWHAVAFAVETPERVAPGKGPKDAAILAPTRVKARSSRSGVGGGGRGARDSKPGDVIDVSSLLKVIRADKNEAPTGSPEIRAGVDKLRQFTVKQLVEGVAAPQAGPDAPVAHANMPEHASASVFASTDLLIYVSASRVFLLDRGGRAIETGGLAADLGLEPSKSNFRLKGFSFEPGGVYFVSKVDLSSRKGHGGDESVVTVRVDQGGRIDQGDIFLRQTNEGLLRVLPIEQEVIRSGAGIGVIVSPRLGERVSNTAGNLMRALERVPGHLLFALGQQLKQMVEDPTSVGMQVLMGEAMGRLQSVMGRLGQVQMAFSALIDAGWFIDLATVATQARSDDEIDIAAQIFARRLAAEIIGRKIQQGLFLGKALARRIIGRIAGRRRQQGGEQQQRADEQRRQSEEEARRQREEEERRQAEADAERHEKQRQAQERAAQQRRDREERARASREQEKADQAAGEAARRAAADQETGGTQPGGAGRPPTPSRPDTEAPAGTKKPADQETPKKADETKAAGSDQEAATLARIRVLEDAVDTAEVFGLGDVPKDRQARREYLKDPAHWTEERRALHERLLTKAMAHSQAFAEAASGGAPTIFAARGNTAVGKTTAIKGNVPELEAILAKTGDIRHAAVNPDAFKADLAENTPGRLTSSQLHLESSILAQRLQERIANLRTSRGEVGSILIDKRLGGIRDVKEVVQLAKDTGRKLNISDVDASLEVSLAGVLGRSRPGEAIPDFDTVTGGFQDVRRDRMAVIKMFRQDPSLGKYELFGVDTDGKRIPIARVVGHDVEVLHPELYRKATTQAGSPATLANTRITEPFIEQFTATVPKDRVAEVRDTLRSFLGMTLKEAIDAHSKAKPTRGSGPTSP